MSKRVVSFGEIMLRLKSPGFERLLQSPVLEATFGGAEANVAVSLAQFGMDSAYVTVLPENEIGDACVAELRRFGVDTSLIRRGPGRMGIYFLESGAGQRPAQVVYDREGSAISLAKPGDFDWRQVLSDAGWFHITGITPAISASAAELSLEAVRAAKEQGIPVSFDFNYRGKLWKYGRPAGEVMAEFVGLADVAIANEEHCRMLLGISVDEQGPERCRLLCDKVRAAFPRIGALAITIRESAGSDSTLWQARLDRGGRFHTSRRYEITHIVDRVGSGDAFTAGLIYGLMNWEDDARTLEFAAAAGSLKHTIPGDFTRASVPEILRLAEEGGSGRVQR